MPAEMLDAAPDPEPSGPVAPDLLLHVPDPAAPHRYRPLLARLAARFGDRLMVTTVEGGALPTRGLARPAFLLLRGGRVVAEAFGDLPDGELCRLLDRALPPPVVQHAA